MVQDGRQMKGPTEWDAKGRSQTEDCGPQTEAPPAQTEPVPKLQQRLTHKAPRLSEYTERRSTTSETSLKLICKENLGNSITGPKLITEQS